MGPSVVVGELSQDRRVLPEASSLADAFVAATGLPRAAPGRSWPSSDWAPTPCSVPLHPCHRESAPAPSWPRSRRVGVNFLVLDEPTNHLDLPAIEQLESALHEYGGTLLLVSHDRRLLESVPLTLRVELPVAGGGN